MAEEWQEKEMALFGKKVVSSGLTSSRFGNISLRYDDKILISATGSMLDELDTSTLIEVDLDRPCRMDRSASIETCVHRAIYQRTAHNAIIHTHSPYAVALSLIEKEAVVPADSEGILFLGDIPIIEGHTGTDLLAGSVSMMLGSHKACIARGHGVFAAGESLCEAYTAACMVEHSSQVRYLVDSHRLHSILLREKGTGSTNQ